MTTYNPMIHNSSKTVDNNQTQQKKKTFDLIKEYLYSQPDKIKKIESVSKSIHQVINEFIEITQNYTNQIINLALKIIPNYTTEGQLAQAVQGILLFYSEGLNKLTSELKDKNIIIKENEKKSILDKFNEQKDAYFNKVRNAILILEKYRKEIQLYQEYLVNEEYNEHMSKGDIKNNDADIIINIKKDDDINNKLKSENIDENDKSEELSFKSDIFDDIGLNKFDNRDKVIENHKSFLSNINESNDMLKKIKVFLSEEKTNIRKHIFNVCDCLIEGLLKCVQNQKNTYDIQNEVIKNLINSIKFEETDENLIRPAPVKLKYLEIYQNYIKEKNDISNNNIKKVREIKEDFNLINKKNIKVPRKSLELEQHIQIDLDTIKTRNTINYSQIGNKLSKEEIMEKFKDMVIKLNRAEIIKIFEIIKSTNIKLSESDIKIIEEETNYKVIHEKLISIFINTEQFNEKDKDILLNLFEKDKIYIIYFIKVLNDHRTKGNFIISENTLKYLGELFKFINNLIMSRNDMELFKFIFILSMTYYHLSEKDNNKKYLFSYIKDHPNYQKVKFWEDYLHELIEHEIKANIYNQDLDIENKEIENLNKEEKEKLINCYFSNFLTAVKAMADFRLDKKFVRDFVEKNKEKYFLSKEQIENVCLIYDVSLNDNENNYKGDFIDKEIQNKTKDNPQDNNKDNEKDKIDNKINEKDKIEKIEEDENKDNVEEDKQKDNNNIENNEEKEKQNNGDINNNKDKKEINNNNEMP